MRTSLRILLLSSAALVTGCGPNDSLFYVEADMQEVCKTESNIHFPAALPGTASVQQAFELPIGDTGSSLPDGKMTSSLQLKVFDVKATAGNPDLRGIESATVTLKQPGSTTPIKLIEYKRPATATSATELALTSSDAVDVLELARQQKLEFTFEARGSLPQQEWTADVRLCAGVRAKVDYFDVVF